MDCISWIQCSTASCGVSPESALSLNRLYASGLEGQYKHEQEEIPSPAELVASVLGTLLGGGSELLPTVGRSLPFSMTSWLSEEAGGRPRVKGIDTWAFTVAWSALSFHAFSNGNR
jgi:hypothetical protein